MRKAILVFDIGTTNFKTLLHSMDGEALFSLSAPLRPAYDSGGMVFQEPTDWRKTIVEGTTRAVAFAAENGVEILGVSVTASRSSVIPLDRNGDHIGPAMMWQETGSRDIVNRLNHGDALRRIFAVTGSRPNTVYSAPKMTWLRQNRPETYAKAHKLAGILDYVIHFLTGRLVTDHTCASRTLLMDIRERRWDNAMLDLFEVEEDKLCELVPPGTIAGGLAANAAGATGLPSGLPVIIAGGDQNSAALGAGVVGRGDVMINMGTGSFLVAAVDEAITDPEMRVMTNASCVPGGYILDAGMLTTGSVHRWFVETFYGDSACGDMKAAYAMADAEAESAIPGANGLLVLPHFTGRGAPHWDNRARGVFHGLGMGHRRSHLSRAVYEGIAGEVAATLAAAKSIVGDITPPRLAGGLSQCRFFNQLLSDMCRTPLEASPVREATARGAWCQAMVALGLAVSREEALSAGCGDGRERFTPDSRLADVYADFLRRRELLFASLAAMRNDCGNV